MSPLPNLTPVLLHSLGGNAPNEYRALIKGISCIVNDVAFYIVETIDRIPDQLDYDHIVIISSCVKENIDEQD